MGCACDGTTRCRVECFECEECLGAPSAPWATSLIVELPVNSSYLIQLSLDILTCSSYDTCTDACNASRTTSEAACDTARTDCNGDCATERATCESACAGDPACQDACAAAELVCRDTCSDDWRNCRASAETTMIGCENTCWTGSGIKDCGKLTNNHATCCSDGDPDTFSGCLSTADSDYYEEIWPGMDAWHGAVKTAWETYSACYWGCDEDDGACQSDCLNDLWVEVAGATSELHALEETAARNRNDDRAACIYTYLAEGEIVDDVQITKRQAPCEGRYLANLKGYDLDADADWFGCSSALYTCAMACDYQEFVLPTDDGYTCHGACNTEASYCVIASNKERRDSRFGECSSHYDGSHQQLRAKCLSACEFTSDLCDLCEVANDSCIISCCAREGEDQEDCEFDCELSYNDCTLGSPCATALTSCLQGCPNDNLGCMDTCIDGFTTCVSATIDTSSMPPNLSCGEYTPCVNACEAELFSDCPSCEEDATGTSDALLCLPNNTFAYRVIPPIGREGICD